MENTVLFIAGSVAIILFVLTLAYGSGLLGTHANAPVQYPVEIQSVQYLTCVSTANSTRDYTIELPSGYRYGFSLLVDSHAGAPLRVEEVKPIGVPTAEFANISALVPAYGHLYTRRGAPWGPAKYIEGTAWPGDVLVVKGADLAVERYGRIYTGGPPPVHVPANYDCPYGPMIYTPSIRGDEISATIQQPGCAPTLVPGASLDGATSLFVVFDVERGNYYYKEFDYNFFLDIGGLGVSYTPTKVKLHASQEKSRPYTDNRLAGLLVYANSTLALYAGASRAPILQAGAPAKISGDAVVGVAREKPASITMPPITVKAVYWRNSGYHEIIIHYDRGTYAIIKNGRVIKNGTLYRVDGTGQDITEHLREDGVVAIVNPNPGHEYHAYVIADGQGYTLYMPPIKDAKLDMIIVWEDLVGFYKPGDPRIDGNGDEWIHVTYLRNGTWRIAGYIARGGFEHDFYIGNKTVFVKPFGAGWSNKENGVYYEYNGHGFPRLVYYPWKTHPVSGLLHYLGIFTSPIIKVKGLFPGDTVVIVSRNAVKGFTANETEVDINLLKTFTPEDIVETLETEGAFTVKVLPSPAHLMYLLPRKLAVHVRAPGYDEWFEVEAPLRITCRMRLSVYSSGPIYRAVLHTKDYNLWVILFNGSSIGVYPYAYGYVYDGNVTIITANRTYVFYAPLQFTVAPLKYMGVVYRGHHYTIPYPETVIVEGRGYDIYFSMSK